MDKCLHCGKPLGNRTVLCHDCASAGIAPEDVTDADEEVVNRLERYFVVASLKCPNCEAVHGTVTVDGETFTAADFDIESLEEWERELENEETWIRENRSAVEAALPLLAEEWPQSVRALRSTVL